MRAFRLLASRPIVKTSQIFTSLRHKFRCLPFFLPSIFGPPPGAIPYPIMDVPHSRFPYEILKIIQEVADSHLIAFDLEFSGVAGRRPAKSGKLTLQEYYEDIKEAAEKYQILQVGFTIVQEDLEKGRYVARPYNFNISPLTPLWERHFGRVWSYHSGAIGFLTSHGFKFDLPITQGVQYLSRKEESEARANMIEGDESRSKIKDMVLKEEHDALINHIRSSVKQWQSQSKDQQEAYLNIPGEDEGVPTILNNYQMRLTHQIVRNEYPNLKTVGMKHFVQVTNPTEDQQESEKLVKAQEREKKIADAIGFRWLIEAIFAGNITGMPDSYIGYGLPYDLNGLTPKEYMHQLQEKLRTRRRILVGHNCFTDLVNLYKCFVGDLPSSVEAFADGIHSLLPGVMDTKYIATAGSKKWRGTSLEEVNNSLVNESLPQIDIPAEYDRYQYGSSYHEAGYDSLLTAKIAIRLSAKLEREGRYLELEKLNEEKNIIAKSEFGADEEVYASAPESLHPQASQQPGKPTPVVRGLLSPVTAIKAVFSQGDKASPSEAKVDPNAASTEKKQETVIAVKERDHAARWKDKNEVAKIRNALAKTNIYESLEMDQSGPDSGDDLMSFSSDSSQAGSPKKEKNLKAMVKRGEIMPRWDGSNDFWKLFGNKLQVNGCQEGVCRLS